MLEIIFIKITNITNFLRWMPTLIINKIKMLKCDIIDVSERTDFGRISEGLIRKGA